MTEGFEPFGAAAISEIKRQVAVAAVAVALAQSMDRKSQAAAAAVATALLLQIPAPAQPPAVMPGNLLSPWQSVMRSNQLAKKSRGSLR